MFRKNHGLTEKERADIENAYEQEKKEQAADYEKNKADFRNFIVHLKEHGVKSYKGPSPGINCNFEIEFKEDKLDLSKIKMPAQLTDEQMLMNPLQGL